MSHKRWCVYGIFDPREPCVIPIYIGKGNLDKMNRIRHHLTRSHNPFLRNVIRKSREAGQKPYGKVLYRFRTEEEAFFMEQWLVALVGRRDTGEGNLCNLTDGGDGVRGYVPDSNRHHNARINDKIAKQIALAKGTEKEIAERFEVTRNTVSCIKSGISWKKVTAVCGIVPADKAERGFVGQHHPLATIDDRMAKKIALATGTNREVSVRLSVPYGTVKRIRGGKSWKHVTDVTGIARCAV